MIRTFFGFYEFFLKSRKKFDLERYKKMKGKCSPLIGGKKRGFVPYVLKKTGHRLSQRPGGVIYIDR